MIAYAAKPEPQYKPRTCTGCHKPFKPVSPNQKRCEACADGRAKRPQKSHTFLRQIDNPPRNPCDMEAWVRQATLKDLDKGWVPMIVDAFDDRMKSPASTYEIAKALAAVRERYHEKHNPRSGTGVVQGASAGRNAGHNLR